MDSVSTTALTSMLLLPPRWVMLGVAVPQGHPVYICGSCFLYRLTIETPGAEFPSACSRCRKVLGAARLPYYADLRALMIAGGHKNLLDGAAER